MDSHHRNPDCDKCGNPGEYLWAMGGDPSWFCRGCHTILKLFVPSDVIPKFLGNKLPVTEVQKDMIEARKVRNTGESPWKEKKQ